MASIATEKPKKKRSLTQIKLYVDIFLLIGFILVNMPQSTGIPFHEWVSFLFIMPLILHILLDWKWVVSVTKRMFGRLPGEVRVNHILDLVIFIMMVLAMFTGTIISEAALPAMGINITIDPFWQGMHDLTANLTMLLIGIHLAMHWPWIKSAFSRYILKGKK
ncbi:MAG: DUF4405 domain-containing protein [Anaerolineae bacterium]